MNTASLTGEQEEASTNVKPEQQEDRKNRLNFIYKKCTCAVHSEDGNALSFVSTVSST
ncbi:hypothetical protein SESBI_41080 [Sesbania bispinosa]|nr:hypothetical protein SESBI_41080 [Sesbania bispinosa]